MAACGTVDPSVRVQIPVLALKKKVKKMERYDPLKEREFERKRMFEKYREGEISEEEYKSFLVYSGIYKIVEGVQLRPNKSEEDKR